MPRAGAGYFTAEQRRRGFLVSYKLLYGQLHGRGLSNQIASKATRKTGNLAMAGVTTPG